MRLVVTRSARLAVDDDGDPSLPAVVLLHAGNATRSMWDPLLQPLSTGHRVVRYDARGFGGSSPVTDRYVGSDEVVAVLDALGIERATLVGSSFGGRVALDTALAEPRRVSAVVMIGSVPSGTGAEYRDAEQRLADAADAAEAAHDWVRRAELDVDIWHVGPTRRRDEVDPRYLAHAVGYAHEHVELLRTQPSVLSDAGAPPAAERLGELTAPLLSIVGRHDFAFIRAQQARTLLLAGSDSEGVTIGDAAHFPGLEQPAAVLDVLLPWLAAHRL